jgi:RNA methyltransferase, TrmH family
MISINIIIMRDVIMLSKDNKNVKLALKLKQKKFRELEGKFLVEGIRFVEEAIKEGVVEYILYSEKLNSTEDAYRVIENSLPKYEVDANVLKELSGTETPQGVIAVVTKREYCFEDIKQDFVIIVDGVQDPGNLGAIIRTSDAAGAGAVILLSGTVDVYNDKTLRSTMGSIFHIPIINSDSFEELSEELKKKGYNIFASSLEESKNLFECDFKSSVAIMIGNEAKGIPKEHMELATQKLRIPMPGNAESLNAAAAGAIIIYEVLRQRGIYGED